MASNILKPNLDSLLAAVDGMSARCVGWHSSLVLKSSFSEGTSSRKRYFRDGATIRPESMLPTKAKATLLMLRWRLL